MRTRRKIDTSQPAIVRRFRQWGATVAHTHMVGDGFPDIVIGMCGVTHLVEIKDGALPPSRRALSEGQIDFARHWAGSDVMLVESVQDVDDVCGRIRQRHAKKYTDAIAPPIS